MAVKPGKRLIVACDGTWANSDNGFKRDSYLPWKTGGKLAIPTNVTRLCRALLPRGADGVSQVVFYQTGLGSEDNWYSQYVGGYLGVGASEHIREAYAFVCNNYEDGDEIFLVGFSRGAFIARSVLGLISAVGLLTKKGLGDFYPIFRDWENQADPSYYNAKDRWIEAAYFPNRPNYTNPSERDAYVAQLQKLGLSRTKVDVHCCGVFDTVGTLGVPQIVTPPLSWFQSSSSKEYAFVNTEIPTNLKYAFQALALDDRRTAFSPTVWELPKGGTHALKELKQCWFAGSHSNVGGSYPDTGQADLTLAWMMQQLTKAGLTFDSGYLKWQNELHEQWLQAPAKINTDQIPDRPWGCGKVYDSSGITDRFTGLSNRTPGTYTRTNPETGAATTTRLWKTHEFIHPSVRVRVALKGKQTGDPVTGVYNDPWPLKDWTLVPPGGKAGISTKLPEYSAGDMWGSEWDGRWKWVKQEANGKVVWIAEDELASMEWDLVATDSSAGKAITAKT